MERQDDLDIAKGIGIVLVVWAHAQGPFTGFINSFHMPLFFFISGILYQDNQSVIEFTKRKVSRLLIPFWTYNFLMYPLFFILYYWRRWDFSVIVREIIEILMTVNKVPFLGATWFLPALFWVGIIVHVLCKIMGKWFLGDIWLFLIGLLVALVGFYITFPYRLSRNFILFFYYIAGHLYCKYLQNKLLLIQKILACPVLLFVGIYLSNKYPNSLADNIYSNKFTFVLGASASIFFLLFISYLLSMLKNYMLIEAITCLGKESIHIVIWQFIAFRIAIIMQVVILGDQISSLMAFPVYDSTGIWFALYLGSGIIGSLLIGRVMDRLALFPIKQYISSLV